MKREAIQAQALVKQYREKHRRIQALRGVSFSVPRGQVFSILGPNGAGKTTLLKILTTISRPDAGSATIEGFDVTRETLKVRQCIGVVAQENHFDRYLSLWDNLTLHAQMHGIPASIYNKQLAALLDKANLYERRHDLTDTLSGGMQRRVALIRALIHHPQVLFLDEPTTGLDPHARRELWETIQRLKASTTVILTTHYMDEADFLSDEILMLHQGEVVMSGTPQGLKHALLPNRRFELTLTEPLAHAYAARFQEAGFPPTEWVDDFRLRLHPEQNLADVLARVDTPHLQALGQEAVDLEAVFLSVANRSPQPL